jgi:hypothetical protein
MAETSNRWKCARRIIELARTHDDLQGVNVEPGWPGDEKGVELIYLDHIEGDLDVPVTRAENARVAYDDRFELHFAVRVVSDGLDRVGTMDRMFQMVAAFQDVIALESQLDNLDGVVAARMQHGREESYDVPAIGFFAHATVIVAVHSRLW